LTRVGHLLVRPLASGLGLELGGRDAGARVVQSRFNPTDQAENEQARRDSGGARYVPRTAPSGESRKRFPSLGWDRVLDQSNAAGAGLRRVVRLCDGLWLEASGNVAEGLARGRWPGVPAVCRPAEFVVQVDHAVERPRRCGTLGRDRGRCADAQFGHQRLDGTGQVAQLKMYVVLKGHKPGLGLVQAGYRIGSGIADFFEACGLGLQLLERLFVHPPERVRFTVQRFFERSDALIYALSARRLNCFLVLLPLMKSEAEPIQLGFETGETLLEIGIILIHRESVRMIHKPIAPVTRFCRSHLFAA
jgi:hypothetical protein